MKSNISSRWVIGIRYHRRWSAIKNVKQLVYAVRQTKYQNEDGSWSVNVSGGMGQVLDYLRYVPGGRIEFDRESTRRLGSYSTGTGRIGSC